MLDKNVDRMETTKIMHLPTQTIRLLEQQVLLTKQVQVEKLAGYHLHLLQTLDLLDHHLHHQNLSLNNHTPFVFYLSKYLSEFNKRCKYKMI